jgi:hypothetical protein
MQNKVTPPINKTSSPGQQALSGIISIVVVLIVGAVVRTVFADHGNGSISDQVQNAISDTSPQPFTSTAYGFRISFPGYPTVNNETIQSGSYSIPETVYERANDNNTAYVAAGYNLSSLPDLSSDPNGVLESSLNGAVEAMGKADGMTSSSITSSSFNQFLDLPGLQATVDLKTTDGTDYTAYFQIFLKADKMFAIETIGIGQSDFNTIAQSFSFT